RPNLCVPALAAEQMEVLSRGRAVRHANVAFGAERQEALQSRTRVLRTLTFVAMRQEQRESGRLAPFRQPRDQELIDDDLGAVREVTELRLPEHQRVFGLDRVAVLEAEAGVFRERAIVQLERCLGL